MKSEQETVRFIQAWGFARWLQWKDQGSRTFRTWAMYHRQAKAQYRVAAGEAGRRAGSRMCEPGGREEVASAAAASEQEQLQGVSRSSVTLWNGPWETGRSKNGKVSG